MRAALIILILVACEPPAPAPQARPSELPASAPAKHPSSSSSEDASPGTMASSARPELDAGSASPCEGVHVDITTAITDARCVFYEEDRAEALRRSYERQFGAAPPKVDGRVLDDGQLELTLTNASATPLVLPLFLSSAIEPTAPIQSPPNNRTASRIEPPRDGHDSPSLRRRASHDLAILSIERPVNSSGTTTADPRERWSPSSKLDDDRGPAVDAPTYVTGVDDEERSRNVGDPIVGADDQVDSLVFAAALEDGASGPTVSPLG